MTIILGLLIFRIYPDPHRPDTLNTFAVLCPKQPTGVQELMAWYRDIVCSTEDGKDSDIACPDSPNGWRRPMTSTRW
jgi:hypothetical protein